MELPRIPQISLRRRAPKYALSCGKSRYEILAESESMDNLLQSSIRLARLASVTEVLATTESESCARWRILASDPNLTLDWLGEVVPHFKTLSGSGSFRGSYAKTPRGTWRIGMQLIPVSDESTERSRLISYRRTSGVSMWIKDGKIVAGFALETANPRDGTQICQSVLLNTAAEIGVRCEIMADPRFAAMVDELIHFRRP